MIYKNEKTGAIIETDCDISGGDWIAQDVAPPKAKKPAKEKAEKENE